VTNKARKGLGLKRFLKIGLAIIASFAIVAGVGFFAYWQYLKTTPQYSLALLVDGVTDQKNGSGKKIYFLRRLPRDPFAIDPEIKAEQTWGKRAYASPPENPREGDDVYDVYSLASGAGINGTRYRDW